MRMVSLIVRVGEVKVAEENDEYWRCIGGNRCARKRGYRLGCHMHSDADVYLLDGLDDVKACKLRFREQFLDWCSVKGNRCQ